MRDSIIRRLEELCQRRAQIEGQLGDPAVIARQERFRDLSRTLAEITPITDCYGEYRALAQSMDETREMLEDPELAELARQELDEGERRMAALEGQLRRLLAPRDVRDRRSVFVEIRAGTGGAEAALFAADLLRMYSRLAERRGWPHQIPAVRHTDEGGVKEAVLHIRGKGVYGQLKFESGTHRVQRVPVTESQGRIHTSACTVAVLPEPEPEETVDIDRSELRIDSYRASGKGGQHVNKTDSAIRITHLPSGMVVECQDERSQHKNRAQALSILQARLQDMQRQTAARERAEERKSLVGSGDRSQRIRTYNFPQGRVTDHRISLSLHNLDEILQGHLDPLTEALTQEHQARQMAALDDQP